MLVCLCAQIRLCEIEESIKHDTLADLYEMGMSQGCGSCRDEIFEIIKSSKELYNKDTDDTIEHPRG
tara:strand:- start:46 stop:246 length:201 start_codon:yes stop_codon:yes gene_type:complete